MRIMRKTVLALLTLALCLTACKTNSSLLPSISGKAGEVLVVIEKEDWDGSLGESVRSVMEDEYPYLPMFEPNYTLINVPQGNFIEMFQVHRNIIFFNINPQNQLSGIKIVRDRWASPQIIINIDAFTAREAEEIFKKNQENIVNAIEQAERDRVVKNTIRYENREVSARVLPVFGGSVKVPSGYELRKLSHNFAWIEYSKSNSSQGIFIYRYPVEGDDLQMEKIIRKRDQILKNNVPGPDEGSYMKTADYWMPETKYISYRGRQFAQTHGQWDLEGAYMGGPFVSHSFYSPDGTEIIVVEAWVYAPKMNKRQLFRQAESLLYTWEWKKEE